MSFGRCRSIVVATLVSACSVAPQTTVGGTVQPPPSAAPATPATAEYRRLERETFAELNAARTNPPRFAGYVSEMIPLYDGMLRRRAGSSVSVRTTEGAAAAREAVKALNGQSAVTALVLNDRLSLAARDLMSDQSRTGNLGHTGSDGSTPAVRISRYGTWGVSYSENITYGTFASGRDVILDLIVDDGVPNRGHRKNIFDPTARVVGIACGPHPKYGSACVIDQAGSFVAK